MLSPSEGPCCNANCTLVPADSSDEGVCSEETDCADAAKCDGTSSFCPKSRAKRNGIECEEGTKV